jgi:TolB protein
MSLTGHSVRATVLVAAVAVLGGAAAAAHATVPGGNGKLAFRRYLDERHTWGALFTANPNGSAIRQITHTPKGVLDVEPDWSPDGMHIAFQRTALNGCGPGCETDEIDVVDGDGSDLTRLAYDPPGTGCARDRRSAGGVCRGVPAWSPDSGQIAFTCEILPAGDRPAHSRICVLNADGTGLRELAPTADVGVNDTAPSWSPDGTRIAFARGAGGRRGVFVMNADGSNPRQLTPWPLRAGQPDWSPDGRRILFYSNWEGPAGISANLHTIDVAGTGLRELTHARGGRVQYLSATFSPDGKWITFSCTPGLGRAGNADVYVMHADGTQVRDVTRSAIWDSGTDWGPRLS